jgi:hypothetical protein
MIDTRLGAPLGSPIPLASAPLNRSVAPVAAVILAGAVCFALAAVSVKGFAPGGAVLMTVLPVSLSILCAAVSLVLLARWSPPSRGTLALYEQGFSFTAPAGERTALLFAEVESLTLRNDPERSSPGLAQRATIRSAAGTIRFRHFSTSKADAVRGFLDKLQERLADAAEARLRAGGSLDGTGWSLGPQGLLWRHNEPRVALSSLAAAGLFQRRVSLWRQGEERAFFSVPANTPNALVLRRVVKRTLPVRPEPARPGELGRVLFETRSPMAPFQATAFALVAVLCFWLATLDGRLNDQIVLALFGSLSLFSTIHDLQRWARTGRRHEHGLSMSTPWGHREILFADIQRFRYSTYRRRYFRYRVTLKAWPAAGPPVILSKDILRPDSDLLALRDLIQKQVAARG